MLERLQDSGVKPKPLRIGGKLAGMAIVITGTLSKISRDEAAERIRALGV